MTEKTQSHEVLLEVKNLKTHFPIRKGLFRKVVGHVKAVDGVNFQVYEGDTLGLVGESGCGKTTTGRTIIRLLTPTSGEIRFNHPKLGWLNLEKMTRQELLPVRPYMQMIFQDPFSSLNPRLTVGKIVGEPLEINQTIDPSMNVGQVVGEPLSARGVHGSELHDRVAELLRVVGLRPEYVSRYPHAFSGGQRQRIGIARALALNPKLVICDEPVSALDVSIQAQVLNLLEDLQEKFNLTYLFVAHDLSVVEHISRRVAVMYVGKLVELAPTEELYYTPRHPYTEALMAAVPKADPRMRDHPIRLPGDVANPANPPSGCYFHPRCQYAKDICSQEEPPLIELTPGHWVSCHLADKLSLRGVLGKRV